MRGSGGRDEDLGRGDDLVAGRVVLAEPGFVEAELVEMLNELEVALERERRVLTYRVERGQEDPELQSAVGVNNRHRSPVVPVVPVVPVGPIGLGVSHTNPSAVRSRATWRR